MIIFNMEDFIKNNINNISNTTIISYLLCNKNKSYTYTENDIKNLTCVLENKYTLKYDINNYLEYKYNNKCLKINNNKLLYKYSYLNMLDLDDGIISLLDIKEELLDNFEGLYQYNDITNNQYINININNIVDLEISTKDNNNYKINILIPNHNIYIDKIINIIYEIKNNM